MTLVTSRISLIGIAFASALVLTACGGPDVKGTPTSAPGTATETSSGSTETTAPSKIKDLAGTDPCSLLTKDELTQLQVKREPLREKVGTADSCGLRLPGYSVGVDVRTSLGLSQVQSNGGQITDITVNGRKAKQVAGQAAGSCLVALDVTESSRVDVQVGGDSADKCEKAKQIAEMVAPKLPK